MKHRRHAPRDRNTSKDRRFNRSGGSAKPVVQKESGETIVGLIFQTKQGWFLKSTNKKEKRDFIVKNASHAESFANQIVVAETFASMSKGRQEIRIIRTLAEADDPHAISAAALIANEIPTEFLDSVLAEAAAVTPPGLGSREDLRAIPLVTIDGKDARDFDDAVFAEEDKDTKGWHLIVAIADVAYYVTPNSALDRSALERGNSVYLPDMVVPMLPERLCNDLCSLRPDGDRPCLAAHLWIDPNGELQKWKFVRGMMKSKARLTYEQVQQAHDGTPDDTTAPILSSVIKPLYGAFHILQKARKKRGAMDLDLPERKIELDDKGKVARILPTIRLDSHKLIEEFMILANVAAATELEGKSPCIYRVHDRPSDEKLMALREFLKTMNIGLAPGKEIHPKMFAQILDKFENTPESPAISEIILRSQAQAVYSPINIGHFGLALSKYAHFTSPIRRYADLVVHRALIKKGNLGNDGISNEEVAVIAETATHISSTERRAVQAEREVTDRMTAVFLLDKKGQIFKARVTGVTKFGIFANLLDCGADGLLPFRALPRDRYNFDEASHTIIGEHTGRRFALADEITVMLDEIDALTGQITLHLVEEKKALNAPKSGAPKRDVGKRDAGKSGYPRSGVTRGDSRKSDARSPTERPASPAKRSEHETRKPHAHPPRKPR